MNHLLPSLHLPPTSSSHGDDDGNNTRSQQDTATVKKLRRNASVRDRSISFPAPLNPPSAPSTTPIPASPSAIPYHISSFASSSSYGNGNSNSNSNSHDFTPPTTLERSSSLLSRSLALAKLTGTAPPTAPASYYSSPPLATSREPVAPLPTLEALRERATNRLLQGGHPGLRRSNTIAGGERRPVFALPVRRENEQETETLEEKPVVLDRAEARFNLMKKLSVRRPTKSTATSPALVSTVTLAAESLAPPYHVEIDMIPIPVPSLAVIALREGHSRPRSGSLGDNYPPRRRKDFESQSRIPVPTLNRTNLILPTSSSPLPPAIPLPTSFSALSVPPPVISQSVVESEGMSKQEEADGNDDEGDASRGGMTPMMDQSEEATPRFFGDFEWTTSNHNNNRLSASPTKSTSSFRDDSPPASPIGSVSSIDNRLSDSDNVPLVLRRGSLPQHLFGSASRFPSSMSTLSSLNIVPDTTRAQTRISTFGIGAVEEDENSPLIRRRGSSASSIFGFTSAGSGGGSVRRGSDATFGFGSRLGSELLGSNESSTSLGLLEGNPVGPDERSDSIITVESDVVRKLSTDSPASEASTVEIDRTRAEELLAEKVERNREAGLVRSRDGAFPPPEAGYQFPSPNYVDISRFSDSTARQSIESIDTRMNVTGVTSDSRRTPRYSRSPILPSTASTSSSPRHLPTPLLPSPTTVDSSHKAYVDTLAAFEFTSSPTSPVISFSERPLSKSLLSRAESTRSARSTKSTIRREFSPNQMGVITDDMKSHSSSSPDLDRQLSDSESSSVESLLFEPEVRQVRLPAEELPGYKILQRLDSILGTEELDSDAPSVLDHPPRRLLLHTPVLQVVNANTVKDRHLFLFTDLLLIAKPLIELDPVTGQPLSPTLETSFVVKSVVELQHLKLAAFDSTEDLTSKKRHPLLVSFVDRFANDPKRAIASLIQKGGLANDGATIANLLFRNQDLNRNQLGAYLAVREHKHILRLYIERFRFAGIRLDDALRIFLMSIRLPHDLVAAEYVLSVVASQWTEMNGSTGFDPSLTLSLVMAIMRLSDALHSGLSSSEGIFSFPNGAVNVEDFIAAFREYDVRLHVPEELLARIYASVRKERIEQASDNSMFSMTPDIEATIEPSKLPTRLTYRTSSDVITITIPRPDSKFSIKLQGTDLKFDPPLLNFSKSATQSFRVTGTALGTRAMVLIKVGANAPRYQGLPLNKVFSIERAFMQHTFQISFINHLEVKRKYMFSTLSAEVRMEWLEVARERIEVMNKNAATTKTGEEERTKGMRAAEMVAIQVLRDALIAPEELPPTTSTSFAAPRFNSAAPTRAGTPNAAMQPTPRILNGRLGTPTGINGARPLVRSNSVSKTYAAGIGKGEIDLLPEGPLSRRPSPGATLLMSQSIQLQALRRESREETNGREEGMMGGEFVKSGETIRVITEQNSLLPLVLGFLRIGAEVAPHCLSIEGSAFQLKPLTPPPTPPHHQHQYYPQHDRSTSDVGDENVEIVYAV